MKRAVTNLKLGAATNRTSTSYKDADWLRSRYWDDELSKREIGDMCGVSEKTVAYYMSKYEIPCRIGPDRATSRLRKHFSEVHTGRPTWNSGLSGKYQAWTKHGKRAPGYKGGVSEKGGRGYRKILCPDHPNADANGYVSEHRLVCEKLLGRYLTPGEIVHHRDRNRLNNDPSNLFIFYGHSAHYSFHQAQFKNPSLTEEDFCRGED